MSTACVKFELDVPDHAAHGLGDALQERGLAVRLFPTGAGKGWRIEAYGYAVSDPEQLRTLVVGDAVSLGLSDVAVDVVWLPATDWLAENRRSFAPLTIGRFHIHDSAHHQAPRANCWPILVDAATAFGTGSHETTRACLEIIDRIRRRDRRQWPRQVLDMGCGSGILGIAAAASMGCKVTARDVDPEAVRVTRLNCRRNGVGSFVNAVFLQQIPSIFVRPRPQYDLVLANILAEPLVRLASHLPSALTRGGRLVLAGILEQQGQRVLRAYLSRGLRLEQRIVLNGWLTLVLSRDRGGR